MSERQVSIRLSGVVTLLAFLVVFGLLIEAGAADDLLVRAIIWLAVTLASVYTFVRLIRGQSHTTDQTVELPAAIRQWLIGESGRE
jgi:hypothetical protein